MCYGHDDDYEGYSRGKDEYEQEYEDMLLQRHIDEHIEEETFKSTPKHGYDSPAYKREIDNIRILELYRKGYSFRKIAQELSCSPSTVRLRFLALIRTPGVQ